MFEVPALKKAEKHRITLHVMKQINERKHVTEVRADALEGVLSISAL